MGWHVASPSLIVLEHWSHWCSRLLDSRTMVSESWFDFVGERELDPVLGLVIDCGGSMLPMNGWNIGFIRENIHLPNTLKFWVEMWCLVLLWPWCIGLICASNSLKMIIEEKKIMRVIKWQPKNILIWKRIQQFSFKYQMTCSSFTPSKINIL